MKNKLNSAIYDFQDQINNIANINMNIDNEIPIIQIFFILFGILKKELNLIFQKEIAFMKNIIYLKHFLF